MEVNPRVSQLAEIHPEHGVLAILFLSGFYKKTTENIDPLKLELRELISSMEINLFPMKARMSIAQTCLIKKYRHLIIPRHYVLENFSTVFSPSLFGLNELLLRKSVPSGTFSLKILKVLRLYPGKNHAAKKYDRVSSTKQPYRKSWCYSM